jgi:hypothetical protein
MAPRQLQETGYALGTTRLEMAGLLLRQSLPGLSLRSCSPLAAASATRPRCSLRPVTPTTCPRRSSQPVASLPLAVFFPVGHALPGRAGACLCLGAGAHGHHPGDQPDVAPATAQDGRLRNPLNSTSIARFHQGERRPCIHWQRATTSTSGMARSRRSKMSRLQFPARRISAIIGPSGCGKSTLLKSLNRLLDLNESVRVAGSVLLDGEDIYAPGVDVTEVRSRIGLLAQKPFPLPMSIFDNVAYGLRLQGRASTQLPKPSRSQLQAVGCGTRSRIASRRRRPGCQAGSSSGSVWRARSPSSRRFCCATNPLHRSTPSRRAASKSCSTVCATTTRS